MAENTWGGGIKRLKNAGSLRKISNQGKISLVMHELGFFRTDNVWMRIEDLLEESRA